MDKPQPKVGVGVIVTKEVNGKTYVLLQERLSQHATGYWGSGGGHLELGESLQDGVMREFREEAGNDIEIKDLQFLGVVNFTQIQPKHYVDISFHATWVSGEPNNTEPEKNAGWKWFPIDDLPSPLLYPVEKYVKALSSGQQLFDSSFAQDTSIS